MEQSSEYLTLAGKSTATVREKMSRFIAFAFPVVTAAEAKSAIAAIANEYHDARHVCWAYLLGPGGREWLSSDNGEPSGTAGKPILGQIRSAGLTNVAVVVVRYFSGIKLGTSGLIVAYREAAREAIEAGETVSRCEEEEASISFVYEDMNAVMTTLKASEARILDQQFDNICRLRLSIRRDHLEGLLARLPAKRVD